MTDKEVVAELERLEKIIVEKASALNAAIKAKREAVSDLKSEIKHYDEMRELLHQKLWIEMGLGWCHRCHDFCPVEQVIIVYIKNYLDDGKTKRTVRSFCTKCAEIILSSPRGDNEYFRARKSGETLEIFIAGEWKPLSEMEEAESMSIEIGIVNFSKDKYSFGKSIYFIDWPTAKLTIGGEEFEF